MKRKYLEEGPGIEGLDASFGNSDGFMGTNKRTKESRELLGGGGGRTRKRKGRVQSNQFKPSLFAKGKRGH